ncbi:MAG: glycerophosphodiester phosphodiesterase [Granulosicoccus sp.]|nr:glycerophosphodiester phosphodiesterase [Granulosicoccus sp.]
MGRSDPGVGVAVYAHRGSTVLAPENTMPAFQLARDAGADVLEIDVRLSRDGHPVVIHDATVDRTCNGHGAVKDQTLVQLKKLDAAYYFTDLEGQTTRGKNIRLCTLAELLQQMPDIGINIDIKDNFYEATLAVAAVLEKSGRQDDVNVGSFHAKSVAWFRNLAPKFSTAATRGEAAQLYFGRSICKHAPYQYLQLPVRYFGIPLSTRRFIQHAHGRGIQCVYWTINDPQLMLRLINLDVSGIVTDRVDILSSILNRNNSMQH